MNDLNADVQLKADIGKALTSDKIRYRRSAEGNRLKILPHHKPPPIVEYHLTTDFISITIKLY